MVDFKGVNQMKTIKKNNCLLVAGSLFILSLFCFFMFVYFYNNRLITDDVISKIIVIRKIIIVLPITAFCLFLYRKKWGKYLYLTTFIMYIINKAYIFIDSIDNSYNLVYYLFLVCSIIMCILLIITAFKQNRIVNIVLGIVITLLVVYNLVDLLISIPSNFRSFYNLYDKIAFPTNMLSETIFVIAILVFWLGLLGNDILLDKSNKLDKKTIADKEAMDFLLTELSEQFESGIIDEEEYKKQKDKLINIL